MAVEREKYGSDMMADVLRTLGIEYVALTPGSTFQGLHDSMANYLGDHDPKMILCCHEGIAVSVAHGYGLVTGKPMVAMVHASIGLLNATNAIHQAWLNQAPVLVVGGGGPMATDKRRGDRADWMHSALVQGNVLRGYVKWDNQPFSLASVPDSLFRAYRVSMTQPRGPVYVCLDAGLQEQVLSETVSVPSPERYGPPSSPQADPIAIAQAAELLVNAQKPVVIADYLGRNQNAVSYLVELADLLSLPVIDVGTYFNFPNTHPLDLTGATEELVREADLVLALDVHGLYPLSKSDRVSRERHFMFTDNTKIIHISLNEYALSSWSQDYGQLAAIDVPIAADTSIALPALIAACRKNLTEQRRNELKNRRQVLEARHRALRQRWQEDAKKVWDEKPISLPRLTAELGQAVRGEDWVLINSELRWWPRRLWDWERPYQSVNGSVLGLGNGLSIALGAALAHQRQGRLCVNIQTDGDMLFMPAALWTAAHSQIPLLTVMFNNRSYYASESHQEERAQVRGRSVKNKTIGTRIENPAIDYATLARSFGVYGEGPIENPADLQPALEKAIRVVKDKKQPALVDVFTQNR